MEFGEMNGVRTITITPNDLPRMTVRSTSASEYLLNRDFHLGDIVIDETGISYCDENGALFKIASDYDQLYAKPNSTVDDWSGYLGVTHGVRAESRKNFYDRIREAYKTMGEDKELFDEHGGTLDEFLSGFSEKKGNE